MIDRNEVRNCALLFAVVAAWLALIAAWNLNALDEYRVWNEERIAL
jgi:hypothetical protein